MFGRCRKLGADFQTGEALDGLLAVGHRVLAQDLRPLRPYTGADGAAQRLRAWQQLWIAFLPGAKQACHHLAMRLRREIAQGCFGALQSFALRAKGLITKPGAAILRRPCVAKARTIAPWASGLATAKVIGAPLGPAPSTLGATLAKAAAPARPRACAGRLRTLHAGAVIAAHRHHGTRRLGRRGSRRWNRRRFGHRFSIRRRSGYSGRRRLGTFWD